MVQVFSQDKKNPKTYRGFSYPTYTDIRAQNSVFSDVMAYNLAMIGLGQKGDTRRTFAAIVSSNYFSVLGVPLARGRAFLPEEETLRRNAPVAIVSYSYWQKHNLNPSVLGSELLVNGHPFTIVGIAPRGFTGTMQVFSAEVWLPMSNYERIANDFEQENKTPFGDRAGQQLIIVGRLKPGMTAASAKPALEGLAANLEKAFPVEQKDQTFTTTPISRFSVSTSPSGEGGMATIAPMLLGMAVVVLLVACLNLANMLLARGTARRKEIAIRLALGGSRFRIVRQLLTEGFVLALLGGIGGLLLGLWSSNLLVASLGQMLPLDIVWSAGPNLAIMAATFGFCVVGTLVFALGPALKLSRSAVVADLKEQAGEDVVRRRWKFLPRNPLVVAQIAFSLALLTAAALFIRGAGKAASVDTGLGAGSTFLLETDASLAGYQPQRAQDLYRNLEERLAALPPVERVSVSATVPFGMVSLSRNVQRAGLQPAPDAKPATAAEGLAFSAAWNSVGADYFATVGLPVTRGRAFTLAEATQPGGPMVAIIDDVLARKLWPEGDALGQRIQYASDNAPPRQRERHRSRSERGPEQFRDLLKKPSRLSALSPSRNSSSSTKSPAARFTSPSRADSKATFHSSFASVPSYPAPKPVTADLLRRTIREVDPALPVLSLKSFAQHLDSNFQLWVVRAGAAMFSVFGGLALGLAVVGLYGVKAYSVARRTREIGIRMALGAQPGMVLRMIMREGSIMLFSGIFLGLLLAAATGKILSGMLYEVGALDPVAFTVAPLTLALAALVATWLPARRATRISPMAALRME